MPVSMDVAQFLPMVKRVVGAHFRHGTPAFVDREDLVQAAMLRLCLDADKLECLIPGAFASRTAIWAMKDELRRTWHPSELDQTDVPDTADGPYETLLAREENRELQLAIDALPDLQRKVVLGVLDGSSQRDLAAYMQTSERMISYLKTAAVKSLQTRLRARGIHR